MSESSGIITGQSSLFISALSFLARYIAFLCLTKVFGMPDPPKSKVESILGMQRLYFISLSGRSGIGAFEKFYKAKSFMLFQINQILMDISNEYVDFLLI